jgi:3-isopropylmalate/(R)-2-methylmalate dehydratase small subunit
VNVEGAAVLIDLDNVDTDVMYPGRFLGILDDAEMATHLFEGLDPSLRDQLVGDTVLVAGANFGTGSSRENVPAAMRAAGIRCVIAKSFARIFQRNCFNLGLPAIPCPDAMAATRPGSWISVNVVSGTIEIENQQFQTIALPLFMVELIGHGGLAPWVRARTGA